MSHFPPFPDINPSVRAKLEARGLDPDEVYAGLIAEVRERVPPRLVRDLLVFGFDFTHGNSGWALGCRCAVCREGHQR